MQDEGGVIEYDDYVEVDLQYCVYFLVLEGDLCDLGQCCDDCDGGGGKDVLDFEGDKKQDDWKQIEQEFYGVCSCVMGCGCGLLLLQGFVRYCCCGLGWLVWGWLLW